VLLFSLSFVWFGRRLHLLPGGARYRANLAAGSAAVGGGGTTPEIRPIAWGGQFGVGRDLASSQGVCSSLLFLELKLLFGHKTHIREAFP
jgi:hypothetical protein